MWLEPSKQKEGTGFGKKQKMLMMTFLYHSTLYIFIDPSEKQDECHNMEQHCRPITIILRNAPREDVVCTFVQTFRTETTTFVVL
jgi:hypothetical protein